MPTLPKNSPNKKTASSDNKKLILKTIFFTLLVLLTIGGLVYLGYLYGQKQAGKPAEKTSPSPAQKQVKEVPFGDEDFETDEEYQKAMQEVTDEGPSGEESPWITYENKTHGFSFQYPSTVFIEETDGVNLPLLYLDTKLIIIPEGYGGFLTPVEINARGEKTYQEATANLSEDIFYPGTYEEEKLKSPLKGIRVSGTCQGFPCDGQEHHLIYLDGPKGLININYTPGERFPKPLFNKILNAFRFL